MADGFFPLTSEQQEWAARAADLAQRKLAPRAAETDRTGPFHRRVWKSSRRRVFGGSAFPASTEDWNRAS
jgi:hypothetical protein